MDPVSYLIECVQTANIQGEKAIPVKWEEEVMVRCLEADDRINIRQPR